MTNFTIARNFARLTQDQLAELTGTTKQYVSQLDREVRLLSRDSAKTYAEIFGVDTAWLMGCPASLPVWDPNYNKVWSLPIVRSEEIPNYGMLYHVYLDETGDVFPVILSQDVQFTPVDWQSPYNAKCVEDIPGTRWRDARSQDAILLDGLPRILE